jgi:hypothetical protein
VDHGPVQYLIAQLVAQAAWRTVPARSLADLLARLQLLDIPRELRPNYLLRVYAECIL